CSLCRKSSFTKPFLTTINALRHLVDLFLCDFEFDAPVKPAVLLRSVRVHRPGATVSLSHNALFRDPLGDKVLLDRVHALFRKLEVCRRISAAVRMAFELYLDRFVVLHDSYKPVELGIGL